MLAATILNAPLTSRLAATILNAPLTSRLAATILNAALTSRLAAKILNTALTSRLAVTILNAAQVNLYLMTMPNQQLKLSPLSQMHTPLSWLHIALPVTPSTKNPCNHPLIYCNIFDTPHQEPYPGHAKPYLLHRLS